MTAYFLLKKSILLKQYETVKQLCDTVSFSFKTNPIAGDILEKETDSEFSVHSLAEAKKIKDSKRVWLFGQGWSKAEVSEALQHGINKFVVDNETDLTMLLDAIESKDAKVSVLLRMRRQEHSLHTGKYFIYGMFSETVAKCVNVLSANKKIEHIGIHFHRKTQNISEWSLITELQDAIPQEILGHISIINIGGGIPVQYKNYPTEHVNTIFSEIKKCKEFLNSKKIKLIIEPGRFIAAPAVELHTTIKSAYSDVLIVDCSIFNAYLDTFIADIRLLVEGECDASEGKAFLIKGCTPDSRDIFRYRVYLKNPKVGSEIVFLNAGAYAFHTDFCELPRVETVIQD